MPTAQDINNIENLSEQKKILLAQKAIDDYVQIMQNLTLQQRQLLLAGMEKAKQDKIKQIHNELLNL